MRALPLLALVAACFNPNLGDTPFKCGASPDVCPPGYTCRTSDDVCVLPGSSGGPDSPTGCTPNTATCSGDLLTGCDGSGQTFQTTCVAGCDSAVSPNACYVLATQNLPSGACTRGTEKSKTLSKTLDTTDCVGSGGVVAPQAGGSAVDLCVFKGIDLTVAAGTTLTISGARPAVLIATGKLQIDGTIDVAGRGENGGPGASALRALGKGASAGANIIAGGGGGGHLTDGGAGGASPDLHSGGAAYGNDGISPVLPGAYGGAGGTPCIVPTCNARSSGGGGGGGLELVGCNQLVLGAGAIIDASGGGGDGGEPQGEGLAPGGGDGGGSGGSVLLEAPVITVPAGASIVANGGGGGSGALVNNAGEAGSDGLVSAKAAPGGKTSAQLGGAGGNGGTGVAVDRVPTDGATLPVTTSAAGAGGGGGAAGKIRINTRSDKPPALNGLISPATSTGAIDRTH